MRNGQGGGWGRWAVALGVAATFGAGLATVAGAAPAVRRVESSHGTCPTDDPPGFYCTIQAAIDDADPGDTIFVKPGISGDYSPCIVIDKRVNVIAGGDVEIGGCDVAVMITASRARFQGFTVEETLVGIEITGSDNVVAANRIRGECEVGVLVDDGAARNLVVANVINVCEVGVLVAASTFLVESAVVPLGVDGVGRGAAGPNNQILHNVAGDDGDGFEVSVSKTTLVGNVATFNVLNGIDIQQRCTSTKIKQTSLSRNVAAQNNSRGEPDLFDIRMDPRSQRPVLKGNTYQTSGLAVEPALCVGP